MTIDLARLVKGGMTRASLRSPIVVYGAGGKGRRTVRFLKSRNLEVRAVLDVRAKPGQLCENLRVEPPDAWANSALAPQCDAVIAIHNPDADIADLIERLRGFGFRRVVAPVELHQIFGDSLTQDYFLTAAGYYADKQAEIARARKLLADDRSRLWFERALKFRLSGDYSVLPVPSREDQYRPRDLPRWSNPMRLVDCGAFDGDTVRHFAAGGYRIGTLAAFEADMVNFRRLCAARSLPRGSYLFPCAVGAETEVLRFASASGAASRIDPNGDAAVACVRLDDVISGFRPTLIKMDVEGFELSALTGAARLTAKYRPGLAISVYHDPGHLWQVPLLIDSWKLGYRFYLRGHAHSTFDLVLYAQAA
jgi:FkbM family methyltransferase